MPDRVYVFDMDDTLYLERDYVKSGFRHIESLAQTRYGIAGVGDRAWELFAAGVRRTTFNLITDEFSLPGDAVASFVAAYRDHEPEIRLAADAELFIRHLPDDAVGTGLVTDGYAAGQWRKVRALRLDKLLDNIVVTGDHGDGWPKPGDLAFRAIEARFCGGSTEFVYFGDNPAKDFHAPHQLGWRTVRVRRQMGLHAELADVIAVDETVSEFPDMRRQEGRAS